MMEQSMDVIKGYLVWLLIRWQERLNYKKVVLVLTGENRVVDEYALKYLDEEIQRKYADQALVIVSDKKSEEQAREHDFRHQVKIRFLSPKKVRLLYQWHCLDRFYKNLIFTYIKTNEDNQLWRFLEETNIDERDVVCLALYNFRKIP